MNTFWKLIKRVLVAIYNRIMGLFGACPLPNDEQLNEELITMRDAGGRDCAVPCVGNSTGNTYEAAHAALHHADLPFFLESPLFSNPWNLYRALIVLGFWKMNVTLQMLLNGKCEAGRTIVLVKKSFTQQHWVVWAGIDGFGNHLLFWGDSEKPVSKTPAQLSELFLTSSPNCAFQVYKANFFRLMFERLKRYLRGFKDVTTS